MSNQPIRSALKQLSFPGLCPLAKAVEALANAGIEERGAIFTRREVVDFILDLIGYTPDNKTLQRTCLLEPSFGNGDFLLPIIDRLLTAWQLHPDQHSGNVVNDLRNCLRGIELHRTTFARTRQKVINKLISYGISDLEASALAESWLAQGDFLLIELSGQFGFVAGNPPYVRQELIPDVLVAEYRTRYKTIFDRADLYIPFIEKSLALLKEDGQLGFICSDRWMKNRYGGPLRRMVAERFHLKIYVDMVDTSSFQTDVIVYPAITIISRERGGTTRITHRPEIDSATLARLASELTAAQLPKASTAIRGLEGVAASTEPWILDSSDQLAILRRLEATFPTIEEAGCKVGIGVATGADRAFIRPYEELDVEPNRKLPLVMTRDILNGTIEWRGFGVVNPFADDGDLVDLQHYPRLKKYLETHKDQIAKRYIARKTPVNWYRTIDRISPDLSAKPKLLIPDIKGKAHVVYENGQFYPHHNLYFITSEKWDLKALQTVLLSGIARLFVSIYSIRMRGGYLRFQAQYLRRIRVPYWHQIPDNIKKELIAAAERLDTTACNRAVFKLYGLTADEQAVLGGNGEESK